LSAASIFSFRSTNNQLVVVVVVVVGKADISKGKKEKHFSCNIMKLTFLSSVLVAVAAAVATASIALPTAVVASHSQTYDYIIVGGGTAGCVAAARLTEDRNVDVLVIEAGHDNSEQGSEYTGTGPVIFPGYPFPDIVGPNIIPINSRESAPGPYTPNQYIPVARTLGGGSSVNGQCYSRLDAEDWDHFGIPGWSYADVLPFQKKIETFHPYKGSGTLAQTFPARGTSGPVSVTSFQPGDLSANIIRKMADVLGLPVRPDLDSGNARGVSQFGRNTKNTSFTRESSWIAYLKPFVSRPNLFIQTDAVVTSIEWQTEKVRGKTQLKKPLVADGVYYTINGIPAATNAYASVRNGGEVILAAGTLNSPKLLMLSGVGPAAHLAARGIDLVMASEQVGKNLQDHMSLPNMAFLFVDPTVTDRVLPVAFGRSGLQSHKFNDYEIAFLQVANGIPLSPTLTASVVVAIVAMTRNSANGTVTLLDTNPLSHPVIDFKAFADPIDTQVLSWIGNVTRTIAMKTPGFIAESAPGVAQIPMGSPLSVWPSWFQSATRLTGAQSYSHFVGTCSMASSIATGVVDNKLKVFGTSNLRVADMSVIPRAPGQRPFATAMLVGERVANFISSGQ
jgi:choline dehydrogenase